MATWQPRVPDPQTFYKAVPRGQRLMRGFRYCAARRENPLRVPKSLDIPVNAASTSFLTPRGG